MLDAAAESGNQALAAACAIYLGVVFVTSRGLIAAPRYRDLLGRIRDCRARIEILAAGDGDPTTKTTCTAVARRLDDLEKHGTVVWRLLPRAGVVAIPLSKLASAWRVLHTAERRLLRLENDDETGILMRSLHLELAASKRQDDGELAATLAVAPGSGPEARALLIGSYERLHAREDAATDAEFEQQRIALWLATTGVGMLLALGMTLDHQLTMLLGALGGFLSPVIGVLRPQPERPRSWGCWYWPPSAARSPQWEVSCWSACLPTPTSTFSDRYSSTTPGTPPISRWPSPSLFCSDSPAPCSPGWPPPPRGSSSHRPCERYSRTDPGSAANRGSGPRIRLNRPARGVATGGAVVRPRCKPVGAVRYGCVSGRAARSVRTGSPAATAQGVLRAGAPRTADQESARGARISLRSRIAGHEQRPAPRPCWSRPWWARCLTRE